MSIDRLSETAFCENHTDALVQYCRLSTAPPVTALFPLFPIVDLVDAEIALSFVSIETAATCVIQVT